MRYAAEVDLKFKLRLKIFALFGQVMNFSVTEKPSKFFCTKQQVASGD